MNVNAIRTIKSGDKIKFKTGFVNQGCHATFTRIVQDGKDGPKAPTIEYEFAGQTYQKSHDMFTR